MNVREYASQFSVAVFSQDVDLGAKIKFLLSHAEYDNLFYTDTDELLERLKENPTHLIVFDVRSSIMPVHEFVTQCLHISKEFKFVFICKAEQVAHFKSYRKFNVYAAISIDDESVADQVLNAVDNVCEILYRTYQNEQMAEELKLVSQEREQLQSVLAHERSAPQVRPYQTRIAEYKSAGSKEQLLDIFYQQTPQQSWIYLKYIPTIQTFLCVSYSQVPTEWVEGLSYKVSPKDAQFISLIMQGELPTAFESYIKGKLSAERLKFLPLLIKDKVEGILISTQDIAADVAEDFSLMSLIYTLLVYESEPKHLDIEDSLTGFYNEVFYNRILERELDRSKRAFAPLSIIKVSIDKFTEIEASQGRAVADEIIQKVSQVIKMTSRLPDYLCRTGVNEFTLVLTNCNRKGAAIRAERFRQALHNEKFVKNDVLVTVSQGISEYPTLTQNAIELDESSRRSMEFIAQKGGDRICIYKPSTQHKPDFVVES